MYSLPFRGKHVSIICSMNLRYCIPVLSNEVSPACKETCFIKFHFSFEKGQCFFNKQYPYNYEEILQKSKRCSIRFWKSEIFFHMISLQIGNIPVPYVACSRFTTIPSICRIHVKSAIPNASTLKSLNITSNDYVEVPHHKTTIVAFSRSHVPEKVKIIVFTRVVFMLKRFSFCLFLKNQVFLQRN